MHQEQGQREAALAELRRRLDDGLARALLAKPSSPSRRGWAARPYSRPSRRTRQLRDTIYNSTAARCPWGQRAAVRGLVIASLTGHLIWRSRWRIERTFAWLAGCRRLHRRCERTASHCLAFASIACTPICYRRLAK